jgi:prepilin-type N-terminal cleavage/methylation domain-containing protein
MFNVQSPTFNVRSSTWNPEPRERGFSILELVVVIVIFSALITALLNRFHHFQELAERAAMESTVRLVKTGLQIRLAELILANQQAEAVTLEIQDPMRWLEPKPGNYGGEYRDPPERGTWYFDARARQLVYVVNTGTRLELDSAAPDRKEIRFQARLLKDRIRAGGATVESVTGVTVAPVRPYRWSRADSGGFVA